jgi:hypothetical protein
VDKEFEPAHAGWTQLKLPHDGLEREINYFNELEGARCVHREIKENIKYNDNHREQVELNALRCRGHAMFRERISFGKPPTSRRLRRFATDTESKMSPVREGVPMLMASVSSLHSNDRQR